MLQDRVLFIDGEALIIDKPAGLAVDRPRDGSISVDAMLRDLLFGFKRTPSLVHRLDRDTSGCLLIARSPKAHARFQQVFEAGLVTKRYVAVLDGEPAEDGGLIDMPLGKTSTAEDGWRMVRDEAGKAARTRWEVIERQPGKTFVQFFPETGRTHQIRVHAASGIGIPIMGDPVYGKGGPAMMLHATELTVPRPDGKPDIHAEAPLPQRFLHVGFGRDRADP